ncbi:FRIGIDA-like protein 1 [Durio zibethinus]|uniref:FRIGIDA-like protein n=1 Tax=Durio zibethinus TaxID=66656 RepID=A0A6P5Y2M6_DURZI|nr:FRIGIDA-like protein 1 [Durio zibethinus]
MSSENISTMAMSSENLSTTPSLRTIESAINLIDVKKEELKKAFDHLQANYLHLCSFSISWSDLDSHFTAIQNSVTQRFRLLESHESVHHPVDAVPISELTPCSTQPLSSKEGDPCVQKPSSRQDRVDSAAESLVNRPLIQLVPLNGEQPSSSNSVGLQSDGSAPASGGVDSVVTRPELKEFCERMDGKGLRKYINDHVNEREAIRMELPGALKTAMDPGAMVLDAMEGFYAENSQSKGNKDPELFSLRWVCVFLLEQLMETGLRFSDEVKERAKKLALEWKGKVKLRKNNFLETLAFLHLVVTYSLGAVVDKEELVGYFFIIARHRQATMLSRSIGLGEKVHDLIKKLLDSGKQLLAVKFVFEFGLAEKYPPVPLLEDYLKETQKLAKQVCKDGKNHLRSQNEATAREIAALKAVIKVIEQHKLETEYSQESLLKRIEQLEKQQADRKHPVTAAAAKPQQQQADRKHPATAPTAKPQQQQQQQPSQQVIQQGKKKKKQAQGKQQQSSNKRPKTTASVVRMAPSLGVAGSSSAVPPFQQSHLQQGGLMQDRSAPYLSLPAGSYGLAGSTPVNPYVGSSAATALYGLAGALMGFSVNPNPAASHLYSYDRPTYGAYGLPPQYHPSYHPQ